MGVFPASEAGFREGFVQSYACCLVFFSPILKILALLTALQASRTAMLFTWYGAGGRWDGIALMMGVLIFFQLAVVSGCLSVSMVWL